MTLKMSNLIELDTSKKDCYDYSAGGMIQLSFVKLQSADSYAF